MTFLSRLRPRPVVFVVVGAVVVLLAGGGFAAVESRQVNSYAEGVWWALSLMTTVGFVGEAPESTAGRVLSSILMVSGFALMTLLTASIASMFVREDELPEELAEREFEKAALAQLEELHRKIDALERRLDPSAPRPGDDGRADLRPGSLSARWSSIRPHDGSHPVPAPARHRARGAHLLRRRLRWQARLFTLADFNRTDGPADAVAHGELVDGPVDAGRLRRHRRRASRSRRAG